MIQRPADEVGVTVLTDRLVFTSAELAVLLRSVVVFSCGFALKIEFLRGPQLEDFEWLTFLQTRLDLLGPIADSTEAQPPEVFRASLIDASGRVLGFETGSRGNEERLELDCWFGVIPAGPDARVQFDWQARGLSGRQVELPVPEILDAVPRSSRVWPAK